MTHPSGRASLWMRAQGRTFGSSHARRWAMAGLLILGIWIGACSPAMPEAWGPTSQPPALAATPQPAEQAMLSPLAPVTLPPPTRVPTLTPLPTATPRPTPRPGQLVVLHTNDNWGETEPCG